MFDKKTLEHLTSYEGTHYQYQVAVPNASDQRLLEDSLRTKFWHTQAIFLFFPAKHLFPLQVF